MQDDGIYSNIKTNEPGVCRLVFEPLATEWTHFSIQINLRLIYDRGTLVRVFGFCCHVLRYLYRRQIIHLCAHFNIILSLKIIDSV